MNNGLRIQFFKNHMHFPSQVEGSVRSQLGHFYFCRSLHHCQYHCNFGKYKNADREGSKKAAKTNNHFQMIFMLSYFLQIGVVYVYIIGPNNITGSANCTLLSSQSTWADLTNTWYDPLFEYLGNNYLPPWSRVLFQGTRNAGLYDVETKYLAP